MTTQGSLWSKKVAFLSSRPEPCSSLPQLSFLAGRWDNWPHCKGGHGPSSTTVSFMALDQRAPGAWHDLTASLSMLEVLLGTFVPDLWSQALSPASSETFKP